MKRRLKEEALPDWHIGDVAGDVMISFGALVAYLRLSPAQAEAVADRLWFSASEARRREQVEDVRHERISPRKG